VRRWVSYHGFALNVENTLDDFALIHPCGYHDIRMTSMAERLGGGSPSLTDVRSAVTAELAARLGFHRVEEHARRDLWTVAGIAPTADTSNQWAPGDPPGPIQGAFPW
jgi:lipoate-protein ligase B